jgi:beta-galactosidase GanA
MRQGALLVALAAAAAVAGEPKPEFVQAVEFPYYLYPRQVWERELVWLKAIGVGAVSFSIPWGWHEAEPGAFDLTGRNRAATCRPGQICGGSTCAPGSARFRR